MPIWIATTPPGTVPAATIRMNSQPASSDAVPIGRDHAPGERAHRRVVPLERRPQRQPAARRAEALHRRVQRDRERRADPEAQEVCGRDVAGVAAEPARRRSMSVVMSPRFSIAGAAAASAKWPRAFWAAVGRPPRCRRGRSAGARGRAAPSTGCARRADCDATVHAERQEVDDHRRRAATTATAAAANPASTTPTSWRSSLRVCVDARGVELGDEDRDDQLGQQRAGHEVVREVRDGVRRLEDVGEERRAEDRAGDGDPQQAGEAAEEGPAGDAEAGFAVSSTDAQLRVGVGLVRCARAEVVGGVRLLGSVDRITRGARRGHGEEPGATSVELDRVTVASAAAGAGSRSRSPRS